MRDTADSDENNSSEREASKRMLIIIFRIVSAKLYCVTEYKNFREK